MKARGALLIGMLLNSILLLFTASPVIAAAEAPTDPQSCPECHGEPAKGWNGTTHARAGVTCLGCHQPETLHKKAAGPASGSAPGLYEAGLCGPDHA